MKVGIEIAMKSSSSRLCNELKLLVAEIHVAFFSTEDSAFAITQGTSSSALGELPFGAPVTPALPRSFFELQKLN
jgi:hypothetical protein